MQRGPPVAATAAGLAGIEAAFAHEGPHHEQGAAQGGRRSPPRAGAAAAAAAGPGESALVREGEKQTCAQKRVGGGA